METLLLFIVDECITVAGPLDDQWNILKRSPDGNEKENEEMEMKKSCEVCRDKDIIIHINNSNHSKGGHSISLSSGNRGVGPTCS
jgi:hypothetical protein